MTKPTPPDDLWDFLTQEAQIYTPPEGAFSVADYAKKLNVSPSSADGRIQTLVGAGKLKYIGKFGPKYSKYFVRVK